MTLRLALVNGVAMNATGWCLVLVIWGDAYSDRHVNALARAARRFSASLSDVVLVTDRVRVGVDGDIDQKPFPAFFDAPQFFRGGYPAKLSMFHREVLPEGKPCVFLDLDTIVLGDLGRLAGLIRDPDDLFMLPPGNLVGFSALRRFVFRMTGGRRFAIGNSSVVVFHSGARPNLCDAYEARYREKGLTGREMVIDDVFISWFGQERLRAVPRSLAVMFRREFLARRLWIAALRGRLPTVRRRRRGIVAITFNGAEHKPEQFAHMAEGAMLHDNKGRKGLWREPHIRPLRAAITEAARALES